MKFKSSGAVKWRDETAVSYYEHRGFEAPFDADEQRTHRVGSEVRGKHPEVLVQPEAAGAHGRDAKAVPRLVPLDRLRIGRRGMQPLGVAPASRDKSGGARPTERMSMAVLDGSWNPERPSRSARRGRSDLCLDHGDPGMTIFHQPFAVGDFISVVRETRTRALHALAARDAASSRPRLSHATWLRPAPL